MRAIRRELRQRRKWTSPPFVDTVDKIQGQEGEAVIVSYGVSDPEAAVREAEFIYGVQRVNVSLTRTRSKTVLFLPRPLVDGSPQVLGSDRASFGLALMQDLVRETERQGPPVAFPLSDGITAHVYRADRPITRR
jgi:DNA replication ATP-dependent helicase Dna2